MNNIILDVAVACPDCGLPSTKRRPELPAYRLTICHLKDSGVFNLVIYFLFEEYVAVKLSPWVA